MTESSDIVALLAADHEEVKSLFSKTTAAPPDSRDDSFCHLVSELVKHEVAEEIVVYPTVRSDAPNGDAVVNPRLVEQSEAEEKLASMEKMNVSSPEFSTQLRELQDAVLEHAAAEEEKIFPLLQSLEPANVRSELGERYEKAKATAPTHPHPHAPDTPPANKVLGPMAALFDKARDAARRA